MRYQFLASEIHNLPDSLCLTDPPVTSSDGESQLNAPLHGWDGFNDKINKKILFRFLPNTGVAGGGGGEGVAWPPIFYAAKIKKGNKRKNERLSKQKLLKGCHQGQNVTILVMFTVSF